MGQGRRKRQRTTSSWLKDFVTDADPQPAEQAPSPPPRPARSAARPKVSAGAKRKRSSGGAGASAARGQDAQDAQTTAALARLADNIKSRDQAAQTLQYPDVKLLKSVERPELPDFTLEDAETFIDINKKLEALMRSSVGAAGQTIAVGSIGGGWGGRNRQHGKRERAALQPLPAPSNARS